MMDKSGQGSRLRQRVIGYVRVSTEEQGNSGIGLESQRAAIEAFAARMDWELIEIFKDIATAVGPSSARDRVNLQRALSAASKNDAKIIVYDWRRLSRDTASFEEIAARISAKDRIVSVLQGSTLQEASAAGQHLYAQKQGEAISRTTKEAMAKKRDEGVVFGNPAILDVQPTGTIAASDKASALVRQIADVLIEFGDKPVSANQVAQILNDRGIRTGQKNLWNKSRITLPLQNARALIADEKRSAELGPYASNPNFDLRGRNGCMSVGTWMKRRVPILLKS